MLALLTALLTLSACSSIESSSTSPSSGSEPADRTQATEPEKRSWQEIFSEEVRSALEDQSSVEIIANCNAIADAPKEEIFEAIIAGAAERQNDLSEDAEPGVFRSLVQDGLVEDTVENTKEAAEIATDEVINLCDELK